MIVDLNKIKDLIRVNELFGWPSDSAQKVKEAIELIEMIAQKTELTEQSPETVLTGPGAPYNPGIKKNV
jgi:hypothetical protein